MDKRSELKQLFALATALILMCCLFRADISSAQVIVTPPSRGPVHRVHPHPTPHPRPHRPLAQSYHWVPPIQPLPPLNGQLHAVHFSLPTTCALTRNPHSGAPTGAACSALNTTRFPVFCRIATIGSAQYWFPGTTTSYIWFYADLMIVPGAYSLPVHLHYSDWRNPLVSTWGSATCRH